MGLRDRVAIIRTLIFSSPPAQPVFYDHTQYDDIFNSRRDPALLTSAIVVGHRDTYQAGYFRYQSTDIFRQTQKGG